MDGNPFWRFKWIDPIVGESFFNLFPDSEGDEKTSYHEGDYHFKYITTFEIVSKPLILLRFQWRSDSPAGTGAVWYASEDFESVIAFQKMLYKQEEVEVSTYSEEKKVFIKVVKPVQPVYTLENWFNKEFNKE